AVRVGATEHRLEVARANGDIEVRFLDGRGRAARTCVASSSWRPGEPVWCGTIDGRRACVQVRTIPNGFDLAHRGVRASAFVFTEREAAAARLMPAKAVTDSGKMVRCPMPGLVVSIAVAEGQEIKVGETLAVIEAMKMENVLRAERDGMVARILAKPGDSLAVDAVILEFA